MKKRYCALGKLIAKRLVDLEKNKEWLAQKTGITLCTISHYCTGISIPSAQSVHKLSVALDLSTDIIIHAIVSETENKAS